MLKSLKRSELAGGRKADDFRIGINKSFRYEAAKIVN
jgi:hypothetical protein